MRIANMLKYVKTVNQAYRHWCLKSVRLPYLPYQLTIEPTNHCNLKCPKCLQGYDDYPRKKGFMPFELFEKIIKENQENALNIYLQFGGESLMHKDFPRMVRLCKEYNIWQTYLHTNGTLLNEEMSHKIIEAGLDNLIISFDGDNKDTYEKLHKGADFDDTIANIKRFLEIKKKLNSPKPFTSIKMIHSLAEQTGELSKDFVNKFKGLPINRIYMERLFAQGQYGQALVDDEKWKVFNKEEMDRKDDSNYFPCYNVYSEVIITFEGKIIVCCRDQECYYEMGDLNKETVADIWNNDAFIEIRENLKNKIIKTPCDLCSSLWCGKPQHFLRRNSFEYITLPKYLIRFYYTELSRKLFSIPLINKFFSP